MADANILTKVKTGLGVTGTYQDGTLLIHIDEVINFLLDGGVPKSVVNSDAAVGVITRGVADLWGGGSSDTCFSEYFLQRVAQLKYRSDEDV